MYWTLLVEHQLAQRWDVLKGVAAGLGKKPRLVVLANAMTEDRVPSRRLETPQLG